MILRILVRFVGAVLFWGRDYEGMSLRPFGADGIVSCDGGLEERDN